MTCLPGGKAWPRRRPGAGHTSASHATKGSTPDLARSSPIVPGCSPGWRWHLGGRGQVAGRVVGPGPSAPLVIVMVKEDDAMARGTLSSERAGLAEAGWKRRSVWTTR
jgi:hypothetical protein